MRRITVTSFKFLDQRKESLIRRWKKQNKTKKNKKRDSKRRQSSYQTYPLLPRYRAAGLVREMLPAGEMWSVVTESPKFNSTAAPEMLTRSGNSLAWKQNTNTHRLILGPMMGTFLIKFYFQPIISISLSWEPFTLTKGWRSKRQL